MNTKDKYSRIKAMGIFQHGGKTLASRCYDSKKDQHFYRLLGGSLFEQEYAVDAIHREIMEELGSEIENVVLHGVCENIFTYEGEPGDEVVFMYTADLANKEIYQKNEFPILDHPDGILEWIPVEDVLSGEKILYPEYDYSCVFNK